MGLNRLPSYRNYWSKHVLLKNNFISKIMSVNNCEHISRFIHFSDNNTESNNKLNKILLLISYFNSKWESMSLRTNYFTVDETMIPYRGRLSIKQYIPSKPVKYGVKVYAVSTASLGYILKWHIYTGKTGLKINEIITDLLYNLPKFSHIFFDSHFTSLKIIKHLSYLGFFATGVVKKNRKEIPNKEENKNISKGESIAYRYEDNLLIKYKDRKLLCILSNYYDNNFFNVDKKNGPNMTVPTSIKNYNNFSKGVDHNNQLCSYYFCKRRIIKWYKKIILFALEVSLVNSYIIFRLNSNTTISLFDYKLLILENYFRNFIEDQIIQVDENKRHRLHGKHFIKRSTNERDCIICSDCAKKRSRTNFICETCNVPLCIDECFKTYHTKLII